MFLDSSRYYKVKKVASQTSDGRSVDVVTLRRLPSASGDLARLKNDERLDIVSQRLYGNPTMYWHIADANSELDARDLEEDPERAIVIPEQ